MSTAQKIRIGLTFCRLYRRNVLVRKCSNFLALFAFRKYRWALQMLSI